MGAQNNGYVNVKALSGDNIAISGTSVEATVKAGTVYRMSATTACTFRWDTNAATTADGGFSGAIAAGETINVYCPSALINVIENAGADGILFMQELETI